LPVAATTFMPTPCWCAKCFITVATAPLCDTMLMPPFRGGVRMAPVQHTAPVVKLMKPRQLGPSSVMPSSRAVATMRSCIVRPSLPVSAKPPASTTAWRMPAAPRSRSASSIAGLGTMSSATSTLSPMSTAVLNDCCPCTTPPLRLTRWTFPSKPSSFRLSKAIFDHVERSVAPTSATDRGLKRRARPVSGAAIAFIRSAA